MLSIILTSDFEKFEGPQPSDHLKCTNERRTRTCNCPCGASLTAECDCKGKAEEKRFSCLGKAQSRSECNWSDWSGM